MCRHLGTLLTQPMHALPAAEFWFLATPSVVFMPHTFSKHPKIALLRRAQEAVGKKQAATHGGGLLRVRKRRYAL